ncbi:MAG: hypothetical protein COA39_004420 [Sulfurimonas sp.]|nr:hypothetical protein [Sulfurimonas sp.]
MKKITLASFVFMVVLVTGVSALIIANGNLNTVSTTDKNNSKKAKDDFDKASDALSTLLNDSTSGSDKCHAYAKIQRYCKAILDYDDDSSDSDSDDHKSDGDSNSDELSEDNVSDYQSKVQKLLDDAGKAMKMCMMGKMKLNCDKEIECQEMKSKFLYNLSGDDDSSRIKYKAHCGDHGSHDDDGSSH